MLSGIVPFCLVLVLALCAPAHAGRLLRWIERPFAMLGRKPRCAVIACGSISLLSTAALSWLGGIPSPRVHDEFSYLLQADTFAHGRLSNPTHPLWMHFESMHIIQQPTYASKYPPAHGLMLALGQVVCGEPAVGAWLCGASASAAICWMLLGFMRPKWAVLGGMLAALHPLLLAWSQSYWGGALAACGGALVLGAAERIRVGTRSRHALLLGVGLALLANTRPFEGLVLSVLVLVPLLTFLLGRNGPLLAVTFKHIFLPACAVLLPVAIWMGYYNWRVTGSPVRMPYQVHEETYGIAPLFLWQPTRPEPTYHHKEMRDLHVGWELPSYVKQQTVSGFFDEARKKSRTMVQTYFPLLAFQTPLLALPWMLRYGKARRILVFAGLFFLALGNATWMQPHYPAPVMGLLILLAVQGLRLMRLWRWRQRHAGLVLVRATLLIHGALLIFVCKSLSGTSLGTWAERRAQMVRELAHQPGRHLIVVRYGPLHVPHDEWVYNSADIDGSKIVWARAMSDKGNEDLVRYFSGRKVWSLEADAPTPTLVPYSSQTVR